MAKTRFEQLPKKDRESIQRYVEMRPKVNGETDALFQSACDNLRNSISQFRSRPVGSGYAFNSEAELLASSFDALAHQLVQRGIAIRLLADTPSALAEGLFGASRLHYIANLAKSPEYAHSDCQHIFDLLLSLAANDTEAVKAYMRRYDSIAKQGHPFTKLLCNSISAILTNRQDERLIEELKIRNETGYDKAMLLAVVAILERNPSQVTSNLLEMLAGHRRKAVNDALLRYFAIPVHALFNLASHHFRDNDVPVPAMPDSSLWDEEVYACVLQSAAGDYLQNFEIFSPDVAGWASGLPTAVPHETLVLPDNQ